MNYYEIADFNPINPNFIIPKDYIPIRRYSPETVLNQQTLEKFKKLDIILREVQLFTTPPFRVTTIHIDGNQFVSKSAVNYVINGPGIMQWYELRENRSNSLITDAGTIYIPFSPENCIETDSLAITKLTLVEICKPHNIKNITNTFRFCFSIRYNNNDTFDSMKEKLSRWNNL